MWIDDVCCLLSIDAVTKTVSPTSHSDVYQTPNIPNPNDSDIEPRPDLLALQKRGAVDSQHASHIAQNSILPPHG